MILDHRLLRNRQSDMPLSASVVPARFAGLREVRERVRDVRDVRERSSTLDLELPAFPATPAHREPISMTNRIRSRSPSGAPFRRGARPIAAAC